MARTKRTAEVDEAIAYCKIHPAIGIARVGNSPDAFFVGPEIPGHTFPEAGGYKDRGDPKNGIGPRIKRQAARFRIFAYDKDGRPLQELGPSEADITWTVHLVNSKAEGDNFAGTLGEELPIGQRQPDRKYWRNRTIDDRASLIIDPGSRTVDLDRPQASFDGGTFRGMAVPLGELRLDEDCRLVVLGGFGQSASSNSEQKIRSYANNDLWHDDVSDGPVTATVKLRTGRSLDVEPAWVVVGPPDFAPAVVNVVSLYDVALDVALRKLPSGSNLLRTQPVSFSDDIAPIFTRLAQLSNVQQGGRGAGKNVTDYSALDALAAAPEERRREIFARFRTPGLDPKTDAAKKQANANFLPALSGDTGDATEGDYSTWLHLTPTQYALLQSWAEGDFVSDWKQGPSNGSTEITPFGLDRAALESCSGGAFYPGIEGGWLLRNPDAYSGPFRLSHDRLKPGDVTRHMACPWQADFFECNTHWWPAQRPDEVLTSEAYRRLRQIEDQLAGLASDSVEYRKLSAESSVIKSNASSWSRGLPTMSFDGDEAMIESWWQHGFIVDQDQDGERFALSDGGPVAVEIDRGKYDGLSWPEYFHILTNIEQQPEFAGKARELGLEFFAGARFDRSAFYTPFDYTPSALDERMKAIYDAYVASMNESHWLDTGEISWDVVVRKEGDKEITKGLTFNLGGPFSKRVVIERLRQMAPFNLVDGAWLQRIQAAGPVDEIRAHLFAIWDDEAGNGRPDQNHCNVYDTLLRSLNVYMPPIASRKFIEQDLLASAYVQPVFQLVVSLFPEEFFPELLGMTLYLEWEASPTLTPAVRMMRNRGIDPHFYSLHVAIDNITAGHGFLAKEAIKLYLQKMEDEGGPEAVQLAWQRIWTGYVTWATAGGLGSDMIERFLTLDQKQIDLSYPAMLLPEHISHNAEFAKGLQRAAKGELQAPLFVYVAHHFSRTADRKIRDASDADLASTAITVMIVDELNRIVQGEECIYSKDRFPEGTVNKDTHSLLFDDDGRQKVLDGEDLVRVNRLLLRDGFPRFVADIPKPEPKMFPDYQEFYKRKFVELVGRKAYAAKPLHSNIQLTVSGETYNLADLFDDPEKLVDVLGRSTMINVDHPRSSRIFDAMSFAGPMYKTFTEDERSVILDWIESLQKKGGGSSPSPVDPQAAAATVLAIIRDNAARAGQVESHRQYLVDGEPLKDRFSDPMGLMQAFARSRDWVVPFNSANSQLYHVFSVGPMAFLSAGEDIKRWIDSGAEVPRTQVGANLELISLAAPFKVSDLAERAPAAPPRASAFAQRRMLIGMGSVH